MRLPNQDLGADRALELEPELACHGPASLQNLLPTVNRKPQGLTLSDWFRATVPKAAIHKNTKPLSSKNEIGTPENLLLPAPAGYSVLSENLNQPQFGCLVAMGADKAHHL